MSAARALTRSERALLARPDLVAVATRYALACLCSRQHCASAARALAEYGDKGPDISGCVREHFPAAVRDQLRELARRVTYHSDAAEKARPPRIRRATMRRLACAVAARDGSGYYGPQS